MQGKYGRTRPYYGDFTGQLQVLDSGPVALSKFTDGTAKTGYYDVPIKLPAGAIPMAWKATTTTGFTDVVSYTPADGTKILFLQPTLQADVDFILDLTGCYTYTPAVGTTIAFVKTATNNTITDSADGFGEFEAGDLVLVQGATAMNGVFTLTAAAEGTLTITGDILTAEPGIAGVSFTKLNNADTGGFVTTGFVATNGITIAGSTSNDGDIAASAITTVKAGVITLSNTTLTDEEPGIAGVSFTKEITTTATIEVGVATDTDRFSADTLQSVAAAGIVGSSSLAADACDGIGAAQTVRVTITEEANDDFTDYTEGNVTVKLLYMK